MVNDINEFRADIKFSQENDGRAKSLPYEFELRLGNYVTFVVGPVTPVRVVR